MKKGGKHTEAAKEKNRLVHIGKKHTEQWKIDQSERSKGNKSRTGQKFTERQRINHSKSLHRGKDHWEWIEDRTKLKRYNRRDNPAYGEWRTKVWLRDNFTCKIANPDCAGRIEAHHILTWSKFPELRYEINNGITLCRFHHPRKRDDEIKLSPYFQSILNVKLQ